MKKAHTISVQSNSALSNLSTYLLMLGYLSIAWLVRMAAWSPLVALWIRPLGWTIPWLAIICPVLLIVLILPMRFSFAQAFMATVQGGSFSVRRALDFSQYQKKLLASLKHALRILGWGVPLLVTLGWLYYLIVWMDVFLAIRTVTAVGNGAACALSGTVNFFAGVFGGQGIQLNYGFHEGIYVICGIAALAVVILTWGIWRCSVYRYLWAYQSANSNGNRIKISAAMRGHRWKQCCFGLYNFCLCLPSLFFVFLLGLSVHSKVSAFISVIFETKTFQPITVSAGEALIVLIGLLLHLLILPVRRNVTARFVSAVMQAKE